MKTRAPLIIGIAIVAGLLGAWSAQFFRDAAPVLVSGVVLPSARPLPNFSLSADTQRFDNQSLIGHWSVMFFGYTNCPDVCPTTLATLKQVAAQLTDLPANQQPQMVFVSVDPQRDTPAQITQYVHFFDPEFVGLTGTQPQVDALLKPLGVPVIINAKNNGTYTVDHSANLFVIDPQGRQYAMFSPPFNAQQLAQDLRTLVQTTTPNS